VKLSLSASRDNIHFDEKTKKIIRKRVKEIFGEIVSTLEAKITSCKTYTKACVSAIEIRNELPSSIKNANSLKMSWNDYPVKNSLTSNEINI